MRLDIRGYVARDLDGAVGYLKGRYALSNGSWFQKVVVSLRPFTDHAKVTVDQAENLFEVCYGSLTVANWRELSKLEVSQSSIVEQ